MCQGQVLPAIKLLCWAKIFFLRVRPPINASVSALGNCAAGFPHAEIICPRPLFAKRRVSDAFGRQANSVCRHSLYMYMHGIICMVCRLCSAGGMLDTLLN